MGSHRKRESRTRLTSPYLRQVSWKRPDEARPTGYPFSLPIMENPDWNIEFTTPVTIIVGSNGVGKSTLLEAIAGAAGFDEAGGAKGYRPIDHSNALEKSGLELSDHLRLSWLPKVTRGWYFRAETFWTVARYLDALAGPAPNYLSYSHGEGFLRVFSERCSSQGLFLMDEPESALSPDRQFDLVASLEEIQRNGSAQVIVCTHSPLLMATPGARIVELRDWGCREISLEDSRNFKVMREFCKNPIGYVSSELSSRRRFLDEIDD